jgi:hypothetical protein
LGRGGRKFHWLQNLEGATDNELQNLGRGGRKFHWLQNLEGAQNDEELQNLWGISPSEFIPAASAYYNSNRLQNLNKDKNVIAAEQFGRNLKKGFGFQNLDGAENKELQNLGGFNKWANSRHPYGLQNLDGAQNDEELQNLGGRKFHWLQNLEGAENNLQLQNLWKTYGW